MRPLMNPVHSLFNQSHQKTILSALLTAAMLLLSACGGSNGDNANGNGDSGSQSNPPVLTVPSDAFVFAVGIPSINTVAGSGAIPASCSIANLPAGLTATGADNGCAISGTATAPSAQSSYTLTAINNDGTSTITIDLSVIIVPPVLAVPSDAFVFLLDVASSNTVAGSGSAPTSCSIAGLPAGLTATVAGNGCAISGTATTPLAQSSYILSASNAAGTSTTTIAIEILIPVDRDANGLIELYTLRQLHNMRYNLNGDSYKTSTADTGSTVGCPDAGCNGYELMNDLDFDTDGDGTWTQDGSGNYSLDSGDSAAPYFVIDSSGSGGWQPVGNSTNNAFNAIFDGNGYVIRNLAIRSELTNIGLFGVTAANTIIRNVGLVNNLSDYTGSSNGLNYVGGLVGFQNGGSITGSYATGNADGGAGTFDYVGGLVGRQFSGSIRASYATGDADGGDGNGDTVGGLVGWQNGGSITGSYATGNADGGGSVGGLVGYQQGGSITGSYATGNADGGGSVGGLVGRQFSGSITASYATGNADGGGYVGGLVGFQSGGSIRASYATGNADGGDGSSDRVGGLVGWQNSGSITGSYATGNADGGDGNLDLVGGLVGSQQGGSIRASYATGNADGGDGSFDVAGGLVGDQQGSISASYATGNADGGDGFQDLVGGLVGRQFGSISASYSFGSKVGGQFAGSDGTPRPTGVTSAAGLTAANVGSSWNSASSSTLGAWDFGGSAQPPAIVFNDYDGVSKGTDYAALFAGYTTLTALIPNQRPASSPQIGTATTDIQLNDGDTANSISGNIDLPTAFNGENLTWSIFYDPAQTDSQVSVDDNRVQINVAHRTARTFILRAVDSNSNIVNDYHLRIIDEDDTAIVLTAPSEAFVFGVDVASTNTIAGSGGIPTSCSIADLPLGLTATVVGNGCAISGTATAPSPQSSYTLTASNAAGTATVTIDLSVIRQPFLTTPSEAFVFALGVASTNTIVGSGGIPTSCSIVGLPAGLTATVAGNGCAISGTATATSALSSYTLSASNDGTSTITIDLSIIAPPVLTAPSEAFIFAVGVASTNTIVGSSGSTPTSCSIADLPAGLTATVAGNGCAISGTATTPLAQRSYTLSASNDDGTTTITIEIQIPVDRDGNGLIELYTLTQLHNMRYNLRGSSYKTGTAGTGSRVGCPNDACIGYELMNDVDFDADGDGQSWTQDSSGNYSLDSGDSAAPYFVIDSSGSGGWQPVGYSENNAFNAIFDGNGYVIRNLAIRSELTNIGLFGVTAANAIIRNVGLVNNLSDYTGSSNGLNYVGGLVGLQNGGSITGSYATGNADGGDGDQDYVGGLVGLQNGGSITGSYATGNADGGDGNSDRVGGLVAFQNGGSITGSYATGNADGGDGNSDRVGGLVAFQNGGSITGSYATGNADGGDGSDDYAGGLVGVQQGSITASYATGNADGGAGSRNRVGGLVGFQGSGGSITASYATGDADGGGSVGGLVGFQGSGGSITASYATGNADGSTWGDDSVGGLVGYQRGSISASYATGNADGGAGNQDTVGGLVGRHFSGSIITASYATGNADGGDGSSDRVGGLVGWQFGGRITGSYSFGSKVGGENAGSSDGTPMPTGVTSAAGLTAANVGSSWNSASSSTLGAWDFGGSAQPPAVVFNDYDGANIGTDYAALFAGYTTLTALIPNQRPASSPQIGTATTDIRLNGGDTANSISGNIDLPATFNGENLTWSVFYDPAPTVSQVSVDDNNRVQINAAHRTTARTFILRARDSNGNIVNDYHLRIIQISPPVLTTPSNAFVFTVDVASTNTIAGSGGTPASCSIAGLPAGLTATVAGNGCAISGTATATSALSSYTLSASNNDGMSTVTISLSVIIVPPVLAVPSDAFVFTLDVASSNTVAGSGSAPTSCSIAGLPAGLTATVAGNGCAISGTATTPSPQSSYTLTASNAAGTATVTIDLSVIDPPVLTAPSDAFVFTLDVASNNTVAGSGGTPTSCSIANLPAGLTATVAGNGCAISGTATAPSAQSSYTLSASNDDGTTTITIEILIPVDRDANGLIELYTLTQLHNMRYNLSGSSYKTSTADTGSTAGCPNAGCNGYELMNDLDFDTDGDGQTWSQDSSGNYSLDSGDSAAPYFVIDSSGSGGWQPVGNSVNNAFNALFDGNGYVIRNLAIRSELTNIGLFGVTAANAIIRNVGLVNNLSDYTGSSNDVNNVGGLVGFQQSGSIRASYATGNADGGAGDQDFVGGLVGRQDGGSIITASYATGNADGGDGSLDVVGGLVGLQFGSISASYATGNADGGDGNSGRVGGLVGEQGSGGRITGSYATGNADGGDGNSDRVGGLVGQQFGGSITGSYATGNADGGDGIQNDVGGLVGYQFRGSITASYATGNADGGAGASDEVGGLVGFQQDGSITASYATGNADGGDGVGDTVGGLVGLQFGNINIIGASYSFGSAIGEAAGSDGTPRPTGVTSAAGLTAANVGSSWNSANDGTLGAWDFGGGAQPPALVFNDYDGVSTGTDYAALFAGYTTLTALIPNQRPASSPQIGTATTDIQLNDGDTANSISGNIDLPTAFNGENLTWSVFYDPAQTDSQVSVDDNNRVQINVAHRTARTFILRAVDSNSNIVNDYHLRIIQINPPVLTVPSEAFVFGVDVASTNKVAGSGGIPTSCSIANLPAGLTATVAGNGCAISGTATAPSALSSYTLTAINNDGTSTITIDLSVIGHPVLTTPSEAFVLVLGVASTNTIVGSGGIPTSCSIVGLPAGLTATVAGNGCAISGTVTAYEALSSYTLSASNDDGTTTITIEIQIPVDRDANGLIELYTLTQLHNMRYSLDGSRYKTSSTDTGSALGCPNDACIGYELMNDLDFDTDGDGQTWSQDSSGNYSLDSGDSAAPYFVIDSSGSGGWQPVGESGSNVFSVSNAFNAVFDGNGYVIRNLAIRSEFTNLGLGLFGVTVANAIIRNVGLVNNLSDYTGSSNGFDPVGGLVGWQNGGSITGSYATGNADGGAGNNDRVGGLVGFQSSGGSITASYATGNADGGDGGSDTVGGLVGVQHGSIIGSYATGNADGGDGDTDRVGGLVGSQGSRGSITASYATGNADGGDGRFDRVGGLVGSQGGSIRASYATGNAVNGLSVGGLVGEQSSSGSITASYATGNAGDGARVGGLVGFQGSGGSITASYATGNAVNGGSVGGLVGWQHVGSITGSYATGNADGGDGIQNNVGGLVGFQSSGGSITASYATGNADGGAGDGDRVGGLVGLQVGSIRASYATGNADGGAGGQDDVGGLVGFNDFGSIRASYSFGSKVGGEIDSFQGFVSSDGTGKAYWCHFGCWFNGC